MRSIDFTPLYRSAIGFDRLANLIESAASNGNAGYPPYNIEQLGDNDYRISMAVAGFTQEELELSFQENLLTVKGNKQADTERHYLYQGIAERGFERRVLGDECERRLCALAADHELLLVPARERAGRCARSRT